MAFRSVVASYRIVTVISATAVDHEMGMFSDTQCYPMHVNMNYHYPNESLETAFEERSIRLFFCVLGTHRWGMITRLTKTLLRALNT